MENPSLEKFINTPEQISEVAAKEKLARLSSEDFRDFAVRFMNIAEYEEALRNGVFRGGFAYAPKAKKNSDPETAPTFQEYLDRSKQKTWEKEIDDGTDWLVGSLNLNMYKHLLDILRHAKENVKTEDPSKKNYRERVINEMKKLLESEIQKEEQVREDVFSDPSLEGQDYLDYIDERYEIFFIVMHLPQLQEQINSDMEKIGSLLGEEKLQEILSLFAPEFRDIKASLSYGVILPDSIRSKIESMSLDENVGNQVLELVDRVFNYKLKIESFGGEVGLTLVGKWLEDPTSIDLRSFINTVASTQMSAYEERQYNLALVIDFSTFSTDGESYRGWGGIKRGKSTNGILGAISIMPNKEMLNKIIDQARKAGLASHPVFDNTGKVRFPTE